MKKLYISLLLSLFAYTLYAQGEWIPSSGTFSRPRTLTTLGELSAVRKGVVVEPYRSLYSAMWDEVWNTEPPIGNSTSNERRERARMAKNAAFLLLINIHLSATTTSQLSVEERNSLTGKMLPLLRDLNPDVETALNYTEWQWRSKELIDYLCAYDMALGAGVPEDSLASARDQLQTFAGNLYREATFSVAGISFFTTIKNNHALMTAAALGMAAVVLNDAGSSDPNRQPANWINAALWNIDNLLWRDEGRRLSEPGVMAGYAEGPHYLRYASLNLLPFFRSLGNVLTAENLVVDYNGSSWVIPHPTYDPNYDLLWEWVANIRTPDGLLPPIEDTFVNEGFPELALTGNRDFVWPINASKTTLAEQLYSTVDMRANFIAARQMPFEKNFLRQLYAMPESGNLIFRHSGTTPFYFHMLGEHGIARESGGGHNQADATSFMVAVGTEVMALDPGYVKYDRREEVGKAANHNMILVDGAGPEIGTPGAANDADAYINDAFSLEDRFSFGSVQTEYRGVQIQRDILAFNGRILMLADFVKGNEEHDYTWQLHGNGRAGGDATTGTFNQNFSEREAYWERNGFTLFTHVVASDESEDYRAESGVHEESYDKTGEHTVLRLGSKGKDRQFLSAIVPFLVQDDLALKSIVENGSTSLISRFGDHTIFSANPDTLYHSLTPLSTDLPAPVSTDAPLIFLSIDIFSQSYSIMFMRNGTSLSTGNREVLSSSTRTDLGLAEVPSGDWVGYCKDSGTIYLGIDYLPNQVIGEGVRSWDILWATGRIRIELEKGGYFFLTNSLSVNEQSPTDRGHIADILHRDNHLLLRINTVITDEFSITISDMTGRTARSVENQLTLSTEGIPSGTYIVALRSGGKVLDSRTFILSR
ncbi:MAG: heparinase II/III family protein [Candidatus Kapaibacterium sp.]